MNIVNCIWEKINLGEDACEVSVDVNESFNEQAFAELDNKYTYQVVKVPAGNVAFSLDIQKYGFQLIETQLNWMTRMKDFNYNHSLLERFNTILSFEDITTEKELECLIDSIDDNMFSTDRVACDPYYGFSIGRKRYVNWIKSAFANHTSTIAYICIEGIKVGFIMFRNNKNRVNGELGGIFKKYQDLGFGILTSSSIPLYVLSHKMSIKMYETATSSNNPSNTKIYSTLGFQIKSMHYVFVKHLV